MLDSEGKAELARKCGTSKEYLRLCNSKGRKPGTELCKALVKADSRLTLAELRPDVWGKGVIEKKAA